MTILKFANLEKKTLWDLSDQNESISPKKDHYAKLYQMLWTNLEKPLSHLIMDLHQVLCNCHELLKGVDVHMNRQV